VRRVERERVGDRRGSRGQTVTTADGSLLRAAHFYLLTEVLWRLALVAAREPMPSAGGDAMPPVRAEARLERHWDPHVRELAGLARHADAVASELRCDIEDSSVPF